MKGYAYLEKEILLDTYGSKINQDKHVPVSAGTFSLRRTNYFNEHRKIPMLLLNHTGQVISLEIIKLTTLDRSGLIQLN